MVSAMDSPQAVCLYGSRNEKIDVGAGGEHAAAVAAGGDDRHVLGFRGVLRGIEVLGRELEQHADDLILHEAESLGATPAVPVADQQPLGGGAPLDQRRLEPAGDRHPELALVAGMVVGQALELGGDGAPIEDFGIAGGLIGRGQHGSIAIAERRQCVTGGRAAGSQCSQGNVRGVRAPKTKINSNTLQKYDKYFLIDALCGAS